MAQIITSVEDVTSSKPDRKVKLIHFTGQLDETNVDDKAKEIYEVINGVESGLFLIMDFEKLEYMNSKSIGYLTDWFTKLSEKKGGVIIACARPNILDILQVVGLSQLVTCTATLDEAKIAAMK